MFHRVHGVKLTTFKWEQLILETSEKSSLVNESVYCRDFLELPTIN